MMSIDGYLEQVRRGMAGMDPAVQRDVLEELRSHLHESVAANGGNLNAAVAGLGDPTAVARRYRDLYGYGPSYRILFAAIAGILGVFTVPVLFGGEEVIFPLFLSAAFLFVEIAFLMWVSVQAGNRAGLVAGAFGLVGRLAGLGIGMAAQRNASVATLEGLGLFLAVSFVLVLIGWLPGQAKRAWRKPGAEL
ncbi:MAG TPA: hypothetical protein VI915_06600 [Thermoplasmata archaeon]|nr:hypothetical protein [Thermoplasmata archaeon]